jgi:MFS family permease
MNTPNPSPPTSPATRVARTYYALNSLFVLAASVIWGVNTLFLLGSGLSIFWVFAVNATFSAGQIVFEVPTGVIADTIGRRASFLIGVGALVVSTLGYVGSSVFHWGLTGFILSSVALGFGFTCQTGAVDAWLVDALDASGYQGSKDRVFARNGIFTGVTMVIGTTVGGFLGQASLTIPYYVRAGLLVIVFVTTTVLMREIGFTPRPLELARFGEESRRIFNAGISYGWRHRVVKPVLFTALVNGFLSWYLFYASQPYTLELLGRENLVWVAGVITAVFALSGVAGNSLVSSIANTRIGKRPANVLVATAAGGAICAVGVGVVGWVIGAGHVAAFAAVVFLLLAYGLLSGIRMPVRQAFLNDHIPSAQRATVLSFDALFGDVGAVGGQLGLGYAAQSVSKAMAYTVGGVAYVVAAPLYRRAGRAARQAGEGAISEPQTATAGSAGHVTD